MALTLAGSGRMPQAETMPEEGDYGNSESAFVASDDQAVLGQVLEHLLQVRDMVRGTGTGH